MQGVLRTRPVPDLGAQTRLFRAMADPARLAILEALRTRELTAGQVATVVQLKPSTASRHLACLRSCGLVESRQEWRHSTTASPARRRAACSKRPIACSKRSR